MENPMLGTHLDMADTAEGTYKSLYGMSKTPDMSSEPAKIKVTNLQSKNDKYIPGVADPGQPEFEFFNDDTQTEPTTGTEIMNSYKALRAAELSKTAKFFRLVYPDKTGFAFSAYPTTSRNGGGPEDALGFKVKMLINSDITDYVVPST